MKQQTQIRNDLLSYLTEIQELIDAEFGVKELPNPMHTWHFTESQILIIFFALKQYLSTEITTRGSSNIIIETNGLLESLFPFAEQFANNRVKELNKIRETKTEL